MRTDGATGTARGIPLRVVAAWSGGWGAVLSLAWWLGWPSWGPLAAAALGAAIWSGAARDGRWHRWLTAATLWLAVALGASIQLRLDEVFSDWQRLRSELERNAARELNSELDALVTRGESAVAELGQVLASGGGVDTARLFSRLELIRRTEGLSALAVFESRGEPVAWAGEHRGTIPVAVRRGAGPYVFYEGPLFSYLYFIYPLEGGGTGVAAVLLEASLQTTGNEVPFAARFERSHGLLPVFASPNRAACPSIWDWSADRAILSVCFTALTPAYWWSRIHERGRWQVGGLLLLAMVLLVSRWYRRQLAHPGLPVALVALTLLVVSFSPSMRTGALFSPSQFVLPRLPWDVSLGDLLLILTSGSLWLLIRAGGGRIGRWRIDWWLQALFVAAWFPLTLRLLRVSTGTVIANRPAGGFLLQLAGILLIAAPLFPLLLHGRRVRFDRPGPTALSGLAVILAAGLSVSLALMGGPQSPSVYWAAAWVLPWIPLSLALPNLSVRRRPLRAWLGAGLVAASCVLPALWTWHVEAKLATVEEREFARLATKPNTFLDFRLRTFAERARIYAAEGESGVNLLYHSWVESGLAENGDEARMTIWQGGRPVDELRLTELSDTMPSIVPLMVERHRGLTEEVLQRHTSVEGLHYLLLVPLPGDRILSVAVPPLTRRSGATPLASFLQPADRRDARSGITSLFLVPSEDPVADSLAAAQAAEQPVQWLPTEDGWRSEARVRYPTGWMHAHLFVRTSTVPMLMIRGVLLAAALLSVLLGIWLLSRLIRRDFGTIPALAREQLRSFRGRLTLALFAFFLLPTGVFGFVAYTAVAREVTLSAEAFARRALDQTVDRLAPGAPLWNVAEEVGADLLGYRRGTLEVAPAPEILELGLFDSWLPPAVHLALASGETLEEVDRRRLGQNAYLVAYRRLDPEVVLASPIPLARDDIAERQTEFRDIALLLSLAGAALSVVLAFFVGRALTRPIDELSHAVSAVGAGNLQVRLPEKRSDEFEGVYRSFNRMTSRLRRARAREVRSARVLAWGEMARQVAHEIKNPLTPIKLAVQHLRRAYQDGRSDYGAILDRNVHAILAEIDRLGEIARAFARFGTPDATVEELETVNVAEIAAETLALYRGAGEGIRYSLLVDEAHGVLGVARRGELKEVLVNLLENAREALGSGGEIRIAVNGVERPDRVEVAVTDSGEGIPPELLDRVFEPHFSTRTSGTGLGLAIVRRMVESWGGEVVAESEAGRGTRMRVLIPRG